MATRKAHARWTGSLKEGKRSVDSGDGLFEGAYSFTSRFEEGTGTKNNNIGIGSQVS
jgi:lipoyl-dependent peroxiredoxin